MNRISVLQHNRVEKSPAQETGLHDLLSQGDAREIPGEPRRTIWLSPELVGINKSLVINKLLWVLKNPYLSDLGFGVFCDPVISN